MKKIIVTGTGYVGLVTGVCLAEKGYKVICVDVDKEKIGKLNRGKCPIYEPYLDELLLKNIKNNQIVFTDDYKSAYKSADIVFIGVGTPERSDGSANLEYIYEVAKQIAENVQRNCLIVVKSTVPVGTNDKIEEYIRKNLKYKVNIEVASNPEFLSQGSAVNDTLNANRIVIGVESKKAENMLTDLYSVYNQPLVITNRKSAEMVKYASNDFLALKVSFINEIANFCEKVGADIEDVVKGMSYDPRIGDKFLKAGIGYGGSCFPKDTKALHWLANDNGYELKTIKATIEINENQKYKLFRKAKKIFGTLRDKKIAVLGITFKPGTDDLREAPSIVNINRLLEEGAAIVAYDPVGLKKLKNVFHERIEYSDNIVDALIDADMAFIFTEWNEIRNLNLKVYCKLMKEPVIFDGRNCYNIKNVEKENIEYYSIGRREIKNYIRR